MRFLLLPFVAALCLTAQTSNYPTSLDTDASLFVTGDNVQTYLTSAMLAGDNVAIVKSSSGFAVNMLATICETTTTVTTGVTKCATWEHMLVTAVNGNVLTVTRASAGTSAIAHASGKLVSILIDSAHRAVHSDAIKKIQTLLGPNGQNFPASPIVNASVYNYAAQTPGGSGGTVTLTASVGASVTLTPCPLGVLGTDTKLRFYLSGGTGTAESVASTGAGTCTSGAASGTVTFTPANNHSGAWTITSSHAGIYEAIAANAFRHIHIPAARYTMRDCLTLPSNQGVRLSGDGYDPNITYGTILDFSTITNGCAGGIQTTAGGTLQTYTISDMALWGPHVTSVISGGPLNGFNFVGSVRVTLSHVLASAFYRGIHTDDAFEVRITGKSLINYNVCQGLLAEGIINLLDVNDSYFDYNGRVSTGGCGPGIYLAADASPNQSSAVTLDRVESAGNGTAPFSGQVITSAPGILATNITGFSLINSYIEANFGPAQVLYLGGMSSVTEFNNQIFPAAVSSTSAITYASDTTAVNSHGNVFYDTPSVRVFGNTDLSTYNIGPDTCLHGSTECTDHPRLLGVGPAAIQKAASSADITLTTSYQDLTSATLTLNHAGTYLITGVFDITEVAAGDVGQVLVGSLNFDGSNQTPLALLMTPTAAARQTVSQTWMVTATAIGKVAKLQGKKLAGTGSSQINQIHTTITAVWIP